MATAGALNNANVTDTFTDDEGEYLFAEIVLGAGSYTLSSLHFYAGDRNSGGSFNDARFALFSGSTAATATKVFQTPHYNSSNPFGSTTPDWRTATAASEAFSGPNVYVGFVSDDGINMTGAAGADAGGITDTSFYQKTTAASGTPSGEFPTSLPDNGADGALSPLKVYITYSAAAGGATTKSMYFSRMRA